jgi:hypothetical protein
MSARTRQEERARTETLARLATLNASAVDLIQSGQRELAMVEALLKANQLFKENKLGHVGPRLSEIRTTNVVEKYRAVFSDLQEGDTLTVHHCSGDNAESGPHDLIMRNKHHYFRVLKDQGAGTLEALAPMLTLFTGLTLRRVSDFDLQKETFIVERMDAWPQPK